MEQMIWALIIVTSASSVNVSTGYPNKALCEDAISIAKTGMTVIEAASEAEKQKLAAIKAKQEWLAAHPDKTDHDYYNRGSLVYSIGSSGDYIKYAKCVLVER